MEYLEKDFKQDKLIQVETKRRKFLSLYNDKQKRAYRNLINGMELAKHFGEELRFLTLTTSAIQIENKNYNDTDLNDSFRKLKQRIKRMTPEKMVAYGYIQKRQIPHYYGRGNPKRLLKFEYFKVTTNEGNGVVHIIFKGDYLPYNYIVDNWTDIHNTWEVNIKAIKDKKKDLRKSANYVVSQYIANQDSSYQRSSKSWYWIIRGYNKNWNSFKHWCNSRFYYNEFHNKYYKNREEINIIDLWKKKLIELSRKPPPHQYKLTGWCA